MTDKIYEFENNSNHGKIYEKLRDIKLHFHGTGLERSKDFYKDREILEYKLVLTNKIKCIDIIDDLIDKSDKRWNEYKRQSDKAEKEQRRREYQKLKKEFV